MSLLLDALQRASQEKEKLAEARASADKPPQPGEPAAVEPFPSLAIDFAPDAPVPESPASPAASSPAEVSATAPAGLTLDPIEALPTPPPVSEPSAFAQPVSGISAGPVAAAPDVNSERRNAYAPEPVAARGEAGASTASPAEAPRASAAAPAHPSPVVSPQVAREILGATAKGSKRSPNRRLIVLGVCVLLIAAANAAFFLGFLDGFLGISGSALAPVVPPPPVAAPPVPPSPEAPAQEGQGSGQPPVSRDAAADTGRAAASPAASSGESSPPRAVSGRDGRQATASPAEARAAAGGAAAAKSASRGAATPVFVAKPAAASVLDSAYAALTEGRLDDASAAYNQALQKNPAERDALLGLAYIAQRQGKRDEARTYYQEALRQEPGHPGATAGLLSLAAESDLQMTVSRAREMAERNPDSAVVLSTLGGILAKEGRIGEAQQAYFKALTLEPDNAFHAYNLAVALDRLHKYPQALGYYQRALTLADKPGAGERFGFPRKEAAQRMEQLRARDADSAQPTVLPDSRAR